MDRMRMMGGWAVVILIIAGCMISGCDSKKPDGSSNPPSAASGSPASSPSPAGSDSSNDPSSGKSTSAPKQELTAARIWERTLETYRGAQTYRDRGSVTLSYKEQGEPRESRAEVAVAFARPNRLHVKAYRAVVASDGESLRARVSDENTNDLDQQVIVRPMGDRVGIADLAGDPLLYDQLSNAMVSGGSGRHPVQLDLLLESPSIPETKSSEGEVQERFTFAGSGRVDGHYCYKLGVTTPDGVFVFWIDRESYLVRRVEYPLRALAPSMVNSPDVREVRLVAEMTGAEIDVPLEPEQFQIPMPDEPKQVKFFVPPPQPLPSTLFGKQVPPFSLLNVAGGKVTRDSLADKIAVMLWFSNHEACGESLRQFAEVGKARSEDDRFAFYAVCTEPSAMSNRAVAKLLERWQAPVGLLRDLEANGLEMLKIVGTPTLLVLDGEGRMQIFEMGANPNLREQLTVILQRLGDGDDLAAEVLAQAEREQKDYERRVALASSGATPVVIDIPVVAIRPRSEPKRFEVSLLWESRDLTAPGNMAILGGDDAGQLAVLDQGKRLVLLDRSGKSVKTIPLPATERPPTFVRTAINKDGQRLFAVGALLGDRVQVLNAEGELLAAYPPAGEQHAGIRDALFADLDSDGTLELYVAFWGTLGFHCVTLEGERSWGERTLLSVLSLATTPPNEIGWRKILAVGEAGRILRVNHFGNADRPIDVAGWSINQLFGLRFPSSSETVYGGVSYLDERNRTFVALDEQFREQWNYPLPEGQPRNSIEFVSSAPLFDEVGQWAIAAADGSIHVISLDGEFSDYFCYGEELTGLAAAKWDEGGVLVVSSPGKIAAWKVQRKAAEPAAPEAAEKP